MLTLLQIRDFAIVEAVEIQFRPGFTALTGETGAGKSILVDALLLAIGGRGDSTVVRHGAERTQITAGFDVSGNAAARAWLEEQSIDVQEECLLRRVVGTDGRSRAWINGQSMPITALRELGDLLVEVHGQLEFQSLARRGYQRDLLDASGDLAAEAAAVRAAWQEWRSAEAARVDLAQRARDREARLDLLAHYVAELDALDPGARRGRRRCSRSDAAARRSDASPRARRSCRTCWVSRATAPRAHSGVRRRCCGRSWYSMRAWAMRSDSSTRRRSPVAKRSARSRISPTA